MNLSRGVKAIETAGILLTYPLRNRADPPSLWFSFFKDPMHWAWDDSHDDRVSRLWHLRMELSTSRKVVYAKWFQNRATFFSRDVFVALRCLAIKEAPPLSRDARNILAFLQESSPRSKKEMRAESGLVGRALEGTYEKAMRELWRSFQVVGFGEIEDGAYPSLAVYATSLIFEDLEAEAQDLDPQEAEKTVAAVMAKSASINRFWTRTRKDWHSPPQ